MRKLSKSRADDEKSSNNGSTVNDDQVGDSVEVENDNTQAQVPDMEKVSADDKDNSDDELLGRPKPAKSKKKKGKASKTKVKAKGRKPKPVANKNEADNEDEDEVDEEYEVEKVVDSKRIKGKLHYLIRWKGYSSDTDTWEPEDTLSCPELISKFNEEKENDGNKGSKTPTRGKKRKSKTDSKSPAKKNKTWDSKSADSNAEYEVERILEVRVKKNGKREFMIHWKGWSNKFDSWEPEDNLNCSDLIEKFMEKVESARKVDSRNLRVAPGSTNRFTLQAPSSGRRLSKRHGQRQRVRYDDAE